MAYNNKGRRAFLKSSGMAAIPLILPAGLSVPAAYAGKSAKDESINFITDGPLTSPIEYAQTLQAIAEKHPETQDSYGKGGAVTKLEQMFAEITGKEKAIFMPTGTMANNLALRVLSQENPKIFVQETSHLYRDEADAAQYVHNKRLLPVAPGKGAFTLEELKEAISYHEKGEYFKSNIGAVSIENPVRRADGEVFPLEEIKKISAYCKENRIKLHLDGARLHLASAYSGVPIKEYASYFNTVYISLYKYLGSKAGAILCGDAEVIDQMPRLIKVFGGNMYQNWPYAAMALDKLASIDTQLQKARAKAEQLFTQINQSGNMKITPIHNGSNVFNLKITGPVNFQKMATHLKDKEQILVRMPDNESNIKFFVNETILKKSNDNILNAFKKAVNSSIA